ncbi:MAG: transcription termination/antitermination protein NusG [Lentisphaeria bacterium]|nr:transcription termination/antitermination protein NusG [Lentisphaeria bacterium]
MSEELVLDESQGQWFFVQALSGHEMKVKESIDKRLVQENMVGRVHHALVPMEKHTEVHGGEKKTVNKKYFPGYVLVIADLYDNLGVIDDEVWTFIKETPSITGFIGERPVPLSPAEVQDIKEMMTESSDVERPKIDYEIGEIVKIKEGPFESFDGKIESIDPDHGKLSLSVTIFGRSTPVEVGYWQVERE